VHANPWILPNNTSRLSVRPSGSGKWSLDEHPLGRAEWPELDPSTATLWGIMIACFGLAVLALAWWLL